MLATSSVWLEGANVTHAFVQPVRGTRDPIPRFVQAEVVGEGTLPLLVDLDSLASDGFAPS